jgi:2-polyprenyl-6-methoxyphenol hydroxylase-like FAD-dependent oxidoreductase
MKVLIVGGGIAGLSAAIACGKNGYQCDVIDISDRVEGANISFNCRAVDALNELGVLNECIAKGRASNAPPFSGALDRYGRLIAPVIESPTETGVPRSLAIYRPRLAQVLRDAAVARGANITIGVSVEHLDQDADGVSVTFTDGRVDQYDLVIGADGYKSRIRALLHGPHLQVEHKGQVIARWVFPTSEPIRGASYVGPWGIILVIKTTEDLVYVASDFQSPKGEIVSPERGREILAEKLSQIEDPNIRMVEKHLSASSQVTVKAYETLYVPSPWHRGRITLAGDAAHSITPYLSSGGGMAIEDAVVLAQELQSNRSVEDALARYMGRRGPRTKQVYEICEDLLSMTQQNVDPGIQHARRQTGIELISTPY